MAARARPIEELTQPSMNLTRVMIVDDNEMFIETARFVLTTAAYVVETAGDASHALLQIPVFRPDLVLIDVQIPVTLRGRARGLAARHHGGFPIGRRYMLSRPEYPVISRYPNPTGRPPPSRNSLKPSQ